MKKVLAGMALALLVCLLVGPQVSSTQSAHAALGDDGTDGHFHSVNAGQ